MKISLILLVFVAYMMICQDTKEMASGGGVVSGGGGTFAGRAYLNAPSIDSDARLVNMDRGRIAGVFEHTSPESWQPMTSTPEQKSAMINVGSRGRISGIPSVPSGVPPYVEEIQPFNLVK